VRKDGGSNQALKNSEGAETERRPEHGKEPVKGGHRPATFGEDEDDDLSDDQQPIDDGPKDSSRLVRDGAVLNIIASLEQLVNGRPRAFGIFEEGVDGGDICDHDKDAAREDEDEGDDANDANGVEAEKEDSTR